MLCIYPVCSVTRITQQVIIIISAVRIFEISNRIVTSVFDSIQNKQNYSKFSNTYRHRFLTDLTNDADFSP